MKKETSSRLLLIIVAFCFIFSLINLISADTLLDRVGASGFTQGWQSGDFDVGFSKILLWIIVSLVVYSIISEIPGINNLVSGNRSFLGMIFAAIVGFLSMAYITPNEVYAMMTAWSAMGFTISIVLPFLIIMAWTILIATDDKGTVETKTVKKVLTYGIWIVFAGFIWAKLLTRDLSDTNTLWPYILVAILATFFGFGGLRLIYLAVRNAKKSSITEGMEDTEEIAARVARARKRGAKIEATGSSISTDQVD